MPTVKPWFRNTQEKRDTSADFPNLSVVTSSGAYLSPREFTTCSQNPIDDIQIGERKFSFPATVFQSPIDTRKIFRDSEKYFGLDFRKIKKQTNPTTIRTDVKSQSNGTLRQKLHKALSKAAQPEFSKQQDFIINDETKKLIADAFPMQSDQLQVRKSGLRNSIAIYLRQLKQYQPYLYQLCMKAANGLNQGSTNNEQYKGFISISAHQSETNLPNLFEQLNKQKFDKACCPIFLFINGDNSKQIQERLSEVENFCKKQQNLNTEDRLDIRVISGQTNLWRYGLKTIPYTTALMSLALNATKVDEDLSSVFLDADIVKFGNSDIIQHLLDTVKDGHVVSNISYRNDETTLDQKNCNYRLIDILDRVSFQVCPGMHINERSEKIIPSTLDTGIHASGGASGLSTMLLALTGAIAAHTNQEDYDMSHRATKALLNSHEFSFAKEPIILHETQSNAILCRPSSVSNEVFYDGGAITRVVDLNLPCSEVWKSHDEIADGNLRLTALNSNQPREFNKKRFEEEFAYKLKTLSTSYQKLFSDLVYGEAGLGLDLFCKGLASPYKDQIIKEVKTLADETQKALSESNVNFNVPSIEVAMNYSMPGLTPVFILEFSDSQNTYEISKDYVIEVSH